MQKTFAYRAFGVYVVGIPQELRRGDSECAILAVSTGPQNQFRYCVMV